MPYPILAPRDTWWKPTDPNLKRTNVTRIEIVDKYEPTGWMEMDEWDASATNDGSVKAYLLDNPNNMGLIISGDGSGRIALSQDASYTFSSPKRPPENFAKCTAITGLEILDTSACTTISHFFAFMTALTTVDVSTMDVSNCTDIGYVFGTNSGALGPNKLTTVIGLENWNTRKAVSIVAFMQGCPNISDESFAPIEDWDVSNLETATNAFYGIQVPRIDLSRWNTAKLKDASHLLSDSAALVDVKLPRLSACENFGAMFNDDVNLEEVDIRNVDFSNALALSQLWERCRKLKRIIGIEKVVAAKAGSVAVKGQDAFGEMLSGCESMEELDLSSLDTRNACKARNSGLADFFTGMTHLRKITLGPNFSYTGGNSDIAPENAPVLPTPDPTYIPGADGMWYDKTGKAYTPEEAIKVEPNTYYASKSTIYDSEPAIMDRAQMREIAEYVRQATGKTELMRMPDVFKAAVDLAGRGDIGLGMTGAAVGQIARIKAVGPDGKPTEWGPVDMPSGGGGETYESDPLYTVTLQQSGGFSLDKLEGAPLLLKRAMVVVIQPREGKVSDFNMIYEAQKGRIGWAYVSNDAGAYTSAWSECYSAAGFWRIFGINLTNMDKTSLVAITTNGYGNMATPVKDNLISRIWSPATFPAGTKVTVYGVRA